jgi:hypothetical protein
LAAILFEDGVRQQNLDDILQVPALDLVDLGI